MGSLSLSVRVFRYGVYDELADTCNNYYNNTLGDRAFVGEQQDRLIDSEAMTLPHPRGRSRSAKLALFNPSTKLLILGKYSFHRMDRRLHVLSDGAGGNHQFCEGYVPEILFLWSFVRLMGVVSFNFFEIPGPVNKATKEYVHSRIPLEQTTQTAECVSRMELLVV